MPGPAKPYIREAPESFCPIEFRYVLPRVSQFVEWEPLSLVLTIDELLTPKVYKTVTVFLDPGETKTVKFSNGHPPIYVHREEQRCQ